MNLPGWNEFIFSTAYKSELCGFFSSRVLVSSTGGYKTATAVVCTVWVGLWEPTDEQHEKA